MQESPIPTFGLPIAHGSPWAFERRWARLLVPVSSWRWTRRAIDLAGLLARRLSASVEVVELVPRLRLDDLAAHEVVLAGLTSGLDPNATEFTMITGDDRCRNLRAHADSEPGTVVCVPARRSTNADAEPDLDPLLFGDHPGPVLVVPDDNRVERDPTGGDVVAIVEGGRSAAALAEADWWAAHLGVQLWVLTPHGGDIEPSWSRATARHRVVDIGAIDPQGTAASFAQSVDARLVFAERSGLVDPVRLAETVGCLAFTHPDPEDLP